MHTKRIITALLLFFPFVYLVAWGNQLYYSIFVIVLSLLGLYEYYSLVKDRIGIGLRTTGLAWGLLVSVSLYTDTGRWTIAVMAAGFVAVSLVRLSRVGDITTVLSDLGYTIIGPLYVSVLMGHLILIRSLPQGVEWTFLLFFSIWMCDISAFYAGLSLGKYKLYPEVSPNKTIEGAVGGIAGTFLVVLAAKVWCIDGITYIDLIIISVGVSVMGQLGDLCESMLKRALGVKDSGILIPGHGGILDRFDSVLFAAPFLYYYLLFVKG